MNDKYIVVNNINAGIKLSESSRFYLSDILTIIIMVYNLINKFMVVN